MRDLRRDELSQVYGGDGKSSGSNNKRMGSENNHAQGSKHNATDNRTTTASK